MSASTETALRTVCRVMHVLTVTSSNRKKGVRNMTIEEAIRHYEESERINTELAKNCVSALAKNHNLENAEKCKQMIEWLRELQERRKAPEIIYCHECIHFQCNMRFDGYVPKGADAYECRRGCGGCDPMDYCSYGERAERKTE